MLKKLPLDEIKIDKSFVEHIDKDPKDYQLIQNIISIGNNQNCTLVAQGVENSQQLTLLKDLGCDLFQGYYYSKPLAPDSLIEFITAYSEK